MKNEDVIAKMNEILVDQEGITTHEFQGCDPEAPKFIGTFEKAEMVGCNVLITFSKEKVLLFTPLSMISIVDEPKEGSYPMKNMCSQLFIGGKSIGKVIKDICS